MLAIAKKASLLSGREIPMGKCSFASNELVFFAQDIRKVRGVPVHYHSLNTTGHSPYTHPTFFYLKEYVPVPSTVIANRWCLVGEKMALCSSLQKTSEM